MSMKLNGKQYMLLDSLAYLNLQMFYEDKEYIGLTLKDLYSDVIDSDIADFENGGYNFDGFKEVLKQLSEDSTLGDLIITDYLNDNIQSGSSEYTGFVGMALQNSEGQSVIILRGSEGAGESEAENAINPFLSKDWIDNYYLASRGSDQFAVAEEFARKNQSQNGQPTIVTGHSKGGANALYVAATLDNVEGAALDGPGISHLLNEEQIERLKNSGMTNYISEGDIVGGLLFHDEKVMFVETSEIERVRVQLEDGTWKWILVRKTVPGKDGETPLTLDETNVADAFNFHYLQAFDFTPRGDFIETTQKEWSLAATNLTQSIYIINMNANDKWGIALDVFSLGQKMLNVVESSAENGILSEAAEVARKAWSEEFGGIIQSIQSADGSAESKLEIIMEIAGVCAEYTSIWGGPGAYSKSIEAWKQLQDNINRVAENNGLTGDEKVAFIFDVLDIFVGYKSIISNPLAEETLTKIFNGELADAALSDLSNFKYLLEFAGGLLDRSYISERKEYIKALFSPVLVDGIKNMLITSDNFDSNILSIFGLECLATKKYDLFMDLYSGMPPLEAFSKNVKPFAFIKTIFNDPESIFESAAHYAEYVVENILDNSTNAYHFVKDLFNFSDMGLDFYVMGVNKYGVLQFILNYDLIRFEYLYQDATTLRQYDPLVLDLDGDGIETEGINKRVFFDIDNDGVKEQVGWIKGEDGILFLDRNNNGIVDNAGELFGDMTMLSNGKYAKDGFEALAEYDANSDRKIDASDPIFSQLKIWKDISASGTAEEGELFSLEELGIKAIYLEKKML